MSAGVGQGPEPLRAIVVDDEPLARARLDALIGRRPDLTLVATCRHGQEAIETIDRLVPDLVFLDVQMPEIDGFEVLTRIGVSPLPSVVFVTAFDRHAVAAFEVDAVDYLLKPFEDERFDEAVDRVFRDRQTRGVDQLSEHLSRLLERRERSRLGSTPPPFAIHGHGRIDLVAVDEVEWIAAEGPYVRIHVAAGSHLVRDSLRRLDETLAAHGFVRVHRGTLVRLDRIRTLHPLFRGEYQIELRSGDRVKLSRTYSRAVRSRLGLSP